MGKDGFPWGTVSLGKVQKMDWRDFELVVGDLYEEMGYTTEVRDGNNDKKIDVIARKRGPGGKTLAIQVKRYNSDNKVNRTEVQEYYGIHTQVGADECVIVTTGEFSGSALEFADKLGIQTIGGEELLLEIQRHASLAFFSKHADAFRISEAELRAELVSRTNRSLGEQLAARTRTTVGQAELLVGRASREVARATMRWQKRYHWALITMRGYDPVLFAEQTNDEDDTDDEADTIDVDPPQFVETFRNKGRELHERGITRLEPPLITWNSSGRALRPSTGVRPRLRREDRFTLPYQSVLVAAATVCCVLVVGASVGGIEVTAGGYPLATLLVVASTIATAGVVIPSLTLSRTPIDAVRIVYSAPSAAPIGIWLAAGYPGVQRSLYGLSAVVVLTGGVFLGHTWLSGDRIGDHPAFAPIEVDYRYEPVHNPVTLLGLVGAGFLWLALALTSLSGIGVGGDTWQPTQYALAAVGFVMVILACSTYVWRGGIVGVTGAVLVAGSLVTTVAIGGSTTFDGSVDTAAIFGSGVVLFVGAMYLLFRTQHRSVARWHVLTAALVALLMLEAVDYWPILALVRAYGTIGVQSLVVLNAIAASALFLTVFQLERDAIRETLANGLMTATG